MPWMFYFAADTFGKAAPLFAFGLLHVAGAIFAYQLERETLGRELDKESEVYIYTSANLGRIS